MREIRQVLRSIVLRLTNPEEHPLTLSQMTRLYIQRKIYLHYRRPPAIQVPFEFHHESHVSSQRIAVIVHCYYPNLMQELLSYIVLIPFPYQLYVSTDTQQKREELISLIHQYRIPVFEVRLAPNRGRDIAPKYITFRDVYNSCDYFLHLHSKKSPHIGPLGDGWRRQLLQALIGSPEIIRSNLRILADERVGLVFPPPLYDEFPDLRWGINFDISSVVAQKLKIDIDPGYCLDYPAGSMFWGKSKIVKPLLDLNLQVEDFPIEMGQLDGGLNHVIERLIVYSARKQGFCGCRISVDSNYTRLSCVRNEDALASSISLCIAVQKQECLRYGKLSLKSQLQNAS